MANYKATFILDTRGREESIDELVDGLQAELASAGAEITNTNNLGRQDFARTPDQRYVSGVYAQYKFSGAADVPGKILEKLRLNKVISHKMIQKI